MSDKEALVQFQRKRVSSQMVHYLVDVTCSLVKIKPSYPSDNKNIVSLEHFIHSLINHSNVQTPTLMSTLVYLARLKTVLPSNVYGIESTRHRIFLGCLILSAKFLNDSSPINKHWSTYTDGLLSTQEVNTIERELLEYLNWDLSMTTEDLVKSLGSFLHPIKTQLQQHKKNQIQQRQTQYERSITAPVTNLRSIKSQASVNIPASNSVKSIQSSVPSLMSASSSRSTLASSNSVSSVNNLMVKQTTINEVDFYAPTMPLKVRNENEGNKHLLTKSRKSMNLNGIGNLLIPHVAPPQSAGYM